MRSDTNLSKSNMNIFEDLSRSMTVNNLANAQNNLPTGSANGLSFKDVNKIIGFKRGANEMLAASTSLPTEIQSKNNTKKVKK
jgi:hypothetical protein